MSIFVDQLLKKTQDRINNNIKPTPISEYTTCRRILIMIYQRASELGVKLPKEWRCRKTIIDYVNENRTEEDLVAFYPWYFLEEGEPIHLNDVSLVPQETRSLFRIPVHQDKSGYLWLNFDRADRWETTIHGVRVRIPKGDSLEEWHFKSLLSRIEDREAELKRIKHHISPHSRELLQKQIRRMLEAYDTRTPMLR